MSYWKILAGAACGVAAVVALPVAGPVGAVTAIGAAVAAAGGAAAGGVAAAMDDSEEQAENRGRRKEAAKRQNEYEKLLSAFKEAEGEINESRSYFDLIIAMEAVGMACAASDGNIAECERKDIDEFIAGISSSSLPENIKKKIKDISENPPNLKTAFELAQKVGLSSFDLYEEIIHVVMHSDGAVDPKEEEFLLAWRKLASAA